MKNLTLMCSFFLLLFFTSCNQNEPTSPEGDDHLSGKLFLKIDKANAPESVVWIEAFLSRQGYDTVSGILNLLSDSTADILMENIQAGEWNLKVDAKDSNEVVIYSGETNVNVFAGFTTQVNLVLEPTGAGVGNIYIWVTWGIPPSGNWIDYVGNPIFISSGSYWDYNGVQAPKILVDNNVMKMYYTGQGGAYTAYIGYAVSNDGINWTPNSNNPVLSPGSYGSWDDQAVAVGTVYKDDNEYKLYYTGWSDPFGNWHIGLATSADGINWVKHPNPVLFGTSGSEFQIAPSSVIRIDSTYYLYYTGRNLPYVDIRLATSSDGINWIKYSGNPILTYNQGWEGSGVYSPSVYKSNNTYIMIFMNQLGTGFGKATSTDAINWTKDESNPFFTKDDTNNHWADYKIAYPNYVRVNNQDRIYYTGLNTNIYPFGMIGYVVK